MIIICKEENKSYIKRLLKEFLFLDIVVVEKGMDYKNECLYFEINKIDNLIMKLEEIVKNSHWIIGIRNDVEEKVLLKNIIYIEGFSKEAYFYTNDNEYMIKETLYKLEEQLNKYGFVRINKSFIVNIFHIEEIIPDIHYRYCLHMSNKNVLVLNRSYVKAFKNKLKGRK